MMTPVESQTIFLCYLFRDCVVNTENNSRLANVYTIGPRSQDLGRFHQANTNLVL